MNYETNFSRAQPAAPVHPREQIQDQIQELRIRGSIEPVRSQDSAAQARIATVKPVANLDSRRLRLISAPDEAPDEGGEEEENDDLKNEGETGREETGKEETGKGKTGNGKTGKEKSGIEKTGKEKAAGEIKTGEIKAGEIRNGEIKNGGIKDEVEAEGAQKERKNREVPRIEARYEGTNGKPVVALAPYQQRSTVAAKVPASAEGKSIHPGLKKRRSKKGEEDLPPTPVGCEWLKTDDGWNLWRYWSEKDGLTGKRIKKGRYAGYLSRDAWQVMKGYDYETFISIIGQRLRRYGQR